MWFLSFFPTNWLEMAPWLAVFGVVALILYLIDRQWRFVRDSSTSKLEKRSGEIDPFDITPLPDFDWRTTPPLKFRNFKPKYHHTMGLINTTLSNLITIDSNYLSRMQYRTKIIENHASIVVGAHPTIIPAVNELYTWLMNSYLPVRFPTLFQLQPSSSSLLNTATTLTLPLKAPSDPIKTLTLIGQNLDEDIILLLPSNRKTNTNYTWRGHIVCCAAGFNPAKKFGLALKDVHAPVPGYKQKLERSMDRFFERLEVGKVVVRSNWMIQTNPHLYGVDESNHLYSDEDIPQDEDIDISQTFFRSERQTLHRLPESKANVFMFKTYMYPIQQLKEEGYGEDLAQAIDGLREGSVPGMWIYKRGVVWGEKLKEFLTS